MRVVDEATSSEAPRTPHKPSQMPLRQTVSPRKKDKMLLSAEAVFNQSSGPPEALLQQRADRLVINSSLQQEPGTPERGIHEPPEPTIEGVFDALDLNGDGVLTRDEFSQGYANPGFQTMLQGAGIREELHSTAHPHPVSPETQPMRRQLESDRQDLTESVVEGLVEIYANELCVSGLLEMGESNADDELQPAKHEQITNQPQILEQQPVPGEYCLVVSDYVCVVAGESRLEATIIKSEA